MADTYENPEAIAAIAAAYDGASEQETAESVERGEREDAVRLRAKQITERLARLEHSELYGFPLTRAQRAERESLKQERLALENEWWDLWEDATHGPRRGTPQWKAMMKQAGSRPRPFRWVSESSGGLPSLGKRN